MDGKTHPLFYGSCIMPIYEFKDTNTGERLEKFLSFSGKDDFLKENPHIEQRIFTAPADVGQSYRCSQSRFTYGWTIPP